MIMMPTAAPCSFSNHGSVPLMEQGLAVRRGFTSNLVITLALV